VPPAASAAPGPSASAAYSGISADGTPAAAPTAASASSGYGAIDRDQAPRPESPFSTMAEMIYPTKKESEGGVINDKYEALPDWMKMPELHHLSKNSALAIAGTLAAGPEDTKKILQKQFPGIQIEQKGKYLLMKSGEDGQEYAWKPGFRGSDALRVALGIAPVAAGTAILASAPVAALAASGLGPAAASLIPESAAGLAATAGLGLAADTTLQGMKVAAGGDYAPGQALMSAALPVVGSIAGGTARRLGNAIINGGVDEVAGAAGQAAGSRLATAQELAATASQSSAGSKNAAADLASAQGANPELLSAGQRMGVLKELEPAHVSSNPAFQQMSNALPDAAARDAAAMKAVGFKLKEGIGRAGAASIDVLEPEVRQGIESQLKDQNALAKGLYDKLEQVVPKGSPAPASNVLSELNQIAAESNGRLPDNLKKIRAAAEASGDGTTWRMLRTLKQDLSASTVKGGAYSKVNNETLKTLIAAADKDLAAAAEAHSEGAGSLLRNADTEFKKLLEMEKTAGQLYSDEAVKALKGPAEAITGEMGKKLISGTKALASGQVLPFQKVMASAPEPLRTKMAVTALQSLFFDSEGKFNAGQFLETMGGLDANPKAKDALMTYLPAEVRSGLSDAKAIARAITSSAEQRAPRGLTFPDPVSKLGFATKVAKLAGAGLSAAKDPLGWLLSGRGQKTPAGEAVVSFLASPAGRSAMGAAAGGAPINPGLLRSIVRSGTWRNLAAAADIPPSQSYRWLEKALTTGAVGSPLRAGMAQQLEENPQ
jgi:hypothetical protein